MNEETLHKTVGLCLASKSHGISSMLMRAGKCWKKVLKITHYVYSQLVRIMLLEEDIWPWHRFASVCPHGSVAGSHAHRRGTGTHLHNHCCNTDKKPVSFQFSGKFPTALSANSYENEYFGVFLTMSLEWKASTSSF